MGGHVDADIAYRYVRECGDAFDLMRKVLQQPPLMQRYPETVDEFVMAFPNRYRADQPAIDCQVDMVDLKLAIGKTPARLTHRGLAQRRLRGTSKSSCTDTQGDKHLKVLTDFALGVISNVRADEAVLRGSHPRAAEPPLAIMDKPRESPHRDADGHPREPPGDLRLDRKSVV